MSMKLKRDIGDAGKLRWGILGAAQIAHKNWKAIFELGQRDCPRSGQPRRRSGAPLHRGMSARGAV